MKAIRSANTEQHAAIASFLQEGESSRQIASKLNCSKSLVNCLLSKVENIPISKAGGRPKKVTPRMGRKISDLIRSLEAKTPQQVSNMLQNTFGLDISSSTVRRQLHDDNFEALKKIKKPLFIG